MNNQEIIKKSINHWQDLNEKIRSAEQQEENQKDMEIERVNEYYEKRRRETLSKKNINNMSWAEVEQLNNLNHPPQKYYTEDVARVAKSGALDDNIMDNVTDVYQKCEELIAEMISYSTIDNETRQLLIRLRELLSMLAIPEKEDTGEIQQSEIRMTDYVPDTQNRIEDIIKTILKNGYAPIKKGAPYLIQKSANRKIGGFASVDILDNMNERIPMETLKKAIPAYLKRNSIIMLAHTSRPVGRVVSHSFTNYKGHPALHIEGELFDQEIFDQIGTVYKGLSLGGRAPVKKTECSENRCWLQIPELDLWEISLCEKPCNPLAVLDEKI